MDSRDPDSSEALLLDTLTQDTNSEDLGGYETTTPDVPPAIARRLFISHFLSTWNSRAFEFGAVLYLASIFSRTLQPMSVYALARGASAIVFSPAVGRYIDTSDRLQVARLSIGKSAYATSEKFIS
jgi:solute carrier family 40 (iron-regulated transporter), member 1